MASFFVYVDFTDDGWPFYVGKGTAARVAKRERNEHHDRVAAKHGCRREVVLETPDEFHAFNREIRLIAELHTFAGDPRWNEIGTNHTTGGEGPAGYQHTFSTRKRMSRSHAGMQYSKQACANMGASHVGRVTSDVTRRKISDALTGRCKSPDAVERMAATRRGKKQVHENGFKGKHHSDDVKKKISEALKRRSAERRVDNAV